MQQCHKSTISRENTAGLVGEEKQAGGSCGIRSITGMEEPKPFPGAQQWNRRQIQIPKPTTGNESRSMPSHWWESPKTQQDLNPDTSPRAGHLLPQGFSAAIPKIPGSKLSSPPKPTDPALPQLSPVAVEPHGSFSLQIQNKQSHELHTRGWV